MLGRPVWAIVKALDDKFGQLLKLWMTSFLTNVAHIFGDFYAILKYISFLSENCCRYF